MTEYGCHCECPMVNRKRAVTIEEVEDEQDECERTKCQGVQERTLPVVNDSDHEDVRDTGDVMFLEEDTTSRYLLEFLWMTQKTYLSQKTDHEQDRPTEVTVNMVETMTDPYLQPAGYQWMRFCKPGFESDVDANVAAMVACRLDSVSSIGLAKEEERAYGKKLGFPTWRRPIDYLRSLVPMTLAIEIWIQESRAAEMIGDYPVNEQERELQKRLLYTWRDLFISDPESMPVTDLVMHTIPTYDHIRPVRAKDRLYTPKEVEWQRENIPRLLKAGVISYCNSPWSENTKHPVKKDGSLRMVNIFCPINAATIKTNYPMKRIEPVVNNLFVTGVRAILT